MTQDIGSILSDRKFEEPAEIQQIKSFVLKTIGHTPSVSVTTDSFIVSVPNASAAGALRPQINALQNQLKTDKRIILRIR